MADMARLVDKQGSGGPRVQGLFVTVDSERDTPQALAKYVTGFHPSFLGLLGTEGETETLAREFKIYLLCRTTGRLTRALHAHPQQRHLRLRPP